MATVYCCGARGWGADQPYSLLPGSSAMSIKIANVQVLKVWSTVPIESHFHTKYFKPEGTHQWRGTTEHRGLRAETLWVHASGQTTVCHFLAVWRWTSSLASLYLSFRIHKMKIVMVFIHLFWEINYFSNYFCLFIMRNKLMNICKPGKIASQKL